MIKTIREFFRGMFGRKAQGPVGRFWYANYQPAEQRILREMDAQLAVPGHAPENIYLHPRDHRLFRRAARRAAAYGKRDDITEDSYRGTKVVVVPWEACDETA